MNFTSNLQRHELTKLEKFQGKLTACYWPWDGLHNTEGTIWSRHDYPEGQPDTGAFSLWPEWPYPLLNVSIPQLQDANAVNTDFHLAIDRLPRNLQNSCSLHVLLLRRGCVTASHFASLVVAMRTNFPLVSDNKDLKQNLLVDAKKLQSKFLKKLHLKRTLLLARRNLKN